MLDPGFMTPNEGPDLNAPETLIKGAESELIVPRALGPSSATKWTSDAISGIGGTGISCEGRGGGILDSLLSGEALQGLRLQEHSLKAPPGGGGELKANPQTVQAPSSHKGQEDKAQVISALFRPGRGDAASGRVPDSLIVKDGRPSPKAAQLCLVCPPGWVMSPSCSTPITNRQSSAAGSGPPQDVTARRTCVDLHLLPRPDLIDCCGDIVAVSSTTGPACVQLFRIMSGSRAGSSGSLASPGSVGTLQLVANFTLSTSALRAADCRLRGIALFEGGGSPASDAVDASSATRQSQSPPSGAMMQLAALIGGIRTSAQSESPSAPAFSSLTKSGSSSLRLSPFVLGIFMLPTGGSASSRSENCDNVGPDAGCTLSASLDSKSTSSTVDVDHDHAAIVRILHRIESNMENRMARLEGKMDMLLKCMQALESKQR